MTILLSVLCLLISLGAFGASIWWTERWNKCVSIGLTLLALALIIQAAPTVKMG